MTQEEKELLLVDLCARLPYGTKVCYRISDKDKYTTETLSGHMLDYFNENSIIEVKPYLRPMSSMTEEEAKEIAILHGVKNILSIKITNEYINITVDDGFSSIDTITIWYDEIVSSIESFDWLNKKMFDYRGLISMGLAIEAPENIYKDEKKI